MHAGENDFLEAARVKVVERRHHAARIDAARSAAGKRHDTESTELIASLLQFQKRARVPVEGHCGHFDRRLFFAQVGDHHALTGSGSHGALEVVEPAKPDYSIDLRCFRQNVRIRLRQASRHDDARVRIEPPRSPRDPKTLTVGAIGNRAGVDDINVGLFSEFAANHA